VTLLLALLSPLNGHAQTTSLLAQTTQAALTRRWPPAANPRLSWLVLDVATGQPLASQWPSLTTAIPVGSLTKPFLALAYARTHATYPRLTCRGTADRCWLPRGHGTLDLPQAIAHSCNAYFLALARQTDPAALQSTLQSYNLPAPPSEATPATLIGLDPSWRLPPLTLARAYAALLTQTQPASIDLIRQGMRLAVTVGTASALRTEAALAKTGTAPCIQTPCRASADGLVIVLTPSAQPRILLLVRQQGATGAATATIAAQMLQVLHPAP
jgi:cell division protein FtsI/penicillin-binding protein 2